MRCCPAAALSPAAPAELAFPVGDANENVKSPVGVKLEEVEACGAELAVEDEFLR